MKRGHCCVWRIILLSKALSDGWLFEAGIGEDRAALIKNGRIIEAHIERHGGVKAGGIQKAVLSKKLGSKSRAIITLENGADAMLSPVPSDISEGQGVTVEITREAIPEKNRHKLPWAKPSDAEPKAAPSLQERIGKGGALITECFAHDADHMGDAGWHDLTEEARSGIVEFAGGSLEISVTPAMILIDVDGDVDGMELSIAAAKAAAGAIRRLGLQGSIGIDFPDVGSKSARAEILTAFDDAMQIDCERTAINGFGFMQVVTRRTRPSLPEYLQRRRTLGHALELLRTAERDKQTGALHIVAHPAITQLLVKREDWMAELSVRTGRETGLRSNPKIGIGSGYAASE